MKKATGLLCVFALVWLSVHISASAGDAPESTASITDRLAQDMFASPPEDITKAELALAFGWAHLFGMMDEPDPDRAAEYLETARDGGLPEADVVLGAMYLGQGGIHGVRKDAAKAMEHYAAAAAKDNVDALRMLGVMYTEGEDGIEPDAEKAFGFFVRAARLGSETALEYLRPRFDEAADWEDKHPGEQADFPSSREALVDPELSALAKERSRRIASVTARVLDMIADAASIEDAVRLSAIASKSIQAGEETDVWRALDESVERAVEALVANQPTEAKQGDAALVVGILYDMGLLNGYNPERARFYLEMALEKGVPEAGAALGELYLGLTRSDESTDEDTEKGLSYLRDAALLDNVDALRVLGVIYADGRNGIEPDPEEAERYFRQAARYGDELAIARLNANPDAIIMEVDAELSKKAAARRAEIDAMFEFVNAEMEQAILKVMAVEPDQE